MFTIVVKNKKLKLLNIIRKLSYWQIVWNNNGGLLCTFFVFNSCLCIKWNRKNLSLSSANTPLSALTYINSYSFINMFLTCRLPCFQRNKNTANWRLFLVGNSPLIKKTPMFAYGFFLVQNKMQSKTSLSSVSDRSSMANYLVNSCPFLFLLTMVWGHSKEVVFQDGNPVVVSSYRWVAKKGTRD